MADRGCPTVQAGLFQNLVGGCKQISGELCPYCGKLGRLSVAVEGGWSWCIPPDGESMLSMTSACNGWRSTGNLPRALFAPRCTARFGVSVYMQDKALARLPRASGCRCGTTLQPVFGYHLCHASHSRPMLLPMIALIDINNYHARLCARLEIVLD